MPRRFLLALLFATFAALSGCATTMPPLEGGKGVYSGPEVNWVPVLDPASGRYGYVDREDHAVKIRPKFADAKPFAWGRASAKDRKTKAWGLVSSEAQWLITPVFYAITNEPYAQAIFYQTEHTKELLDPDALIPLPIELFAPIKITTQAGYDKHYYISPDNRILQKKPRTVPLSSNRYAVEEYWKNGREIPRGQRPVSQAKKVARDCTCKTEKPSVPCQCLKGSGCGYTVEDFFTPLLQPGMVIAARSSSPPIIAYSRENDRKKVGFMDLQGTILTPDVYSVDSYNLDFANGLLKVRKNGLFGLIDATGKEVAAPEYTALQYDTNGYYIAEKNGKKAILDKTARPLTPFAYSRIAIQNPAYFAGTSVAEMTTVDGKNFFWDIAKKQPWISGLASYTPMDIASNRNLRDCRPAAYALGFLDAKNKQRYKLYLPDRTYLGTFQRVLRYGSLERIWLQDLGGKWGALDLAGRKVIPFTYDTAVNAAGNYPIANFMGLTRVTRKGMSFYVDETGHEYIMPATESVAQKSSVARKP